MPAARFRKIDMKVKQTIHEATIIVMTTRRGGLLEGGIVIGRMAVNDR